MNATNAKYHEFTVNSLLFWAMGYGGWMGIGLLPIVWKYSNNFMLKAMISLLAPGICALTMAAFFTIFYTFAVVLRTISLIMLNPAFLVSSMGTITIVVVSLGIFGMLQYANKTAESAEDSEGSGEDSEGSGEDSDGSGEDSEGSGEDSDGSGEDSDGSGEDSDGSGEDSEGSEESDNSHSGTVSDAESTDIEDNSWREEANFEGLRNAPVLSESKFCQDCVSPAEECICTLSANHPPYCDDCGGECDGVHGGMFHKSC
jgi:hypothetical protein